MRSDYEAFLAKLAEFTAQNEHNTSKVCGIPLAKANKERVFSYVVCKDNYAEQARELVRDIAKCASLLHVADLLFCEVSSEESLAEIKKIACQLTPILESRPNLYYN